MTKKADKATPIMRSLNIKKKKKTVEIFSCFKTFLNTY